MKIGSSFGEKQEMFLIQSQRNLKIAIEAQN